MMDATEKWDRLNRSIRKAGRILGLDLHEGEMPPYMNWFVASKMNKDLWARVKHKQKIPSNISTLTKRRLQ